MSRLAKEPPNPLNDETHQNSLLGAGLFLDPDTKLKKNSVRTRDNLRELLIKRFSDKLKKPQEDSNGVRRRSYSQIALAHAQGVISDEVEGLLDSGAGVTERNLKRLDHNLRSKVDLLDRKSREDGSLDKKKSTVLLDRLRGSVLDRELEDELEKYSMAGSYVSVGRSSVFENSLGTKPTKSKPEKLESTASSAMLSPRTNTGADPEREKTDPRPELRADWALLNKLAHKKGKLKAAEDLEKKRKAQEKMRRELGEQV